MSLRYFEKVKKRIEKLGWLIDREVIEIEYDEDADSGIIGGNITFKDGSIFHFKEVILLEERQYRYHYMDKENNLIFRLDTAPHHKEINTFPYHIHLPNGVEESGEVNLFDVLNKIEDIVIKRLEEGC